MEPGCFLVWNVRGLNSRAKRDSVKSVVVSLKPAVVCLQETKLDSVSDFNILSILGSGFSNFVFNPAHGSRGGILVAWCDGSFVSATSVIKNNSVSVQLQSADGPLWWFTRVYGPHQDSLKSAFLQELRDIRNTCVGPWIVAGDFNQIYKPEDKNNSNINRSSLGNFRGLIGSLDLKEIPLNDRRFTWSNQRAVPTLVKLDHVYCTTCWEEAFPDCFLYSSASEISDHCPLILKLNADLRGRRRFHFENFWPKLPGFLEEVAASWDQPVQSSCPLERVSMKLKRLARKLQSWGHSAVGNVNSQLGLAREVLHRLEMAQDSRPLSSDELWLLQKLKQHCLVLASLERTVARLRSRLHYLRDGDANTNFFHLQVRFRKKRNFISYLENEGRTVTSHEQMQEVLDDFFSNLLGSNIQRPYSLNLAACHRDAIDLSSLEAPFSEKEVRDTIGALPSDKAPGPDGFTGKFYKCCWHIIKSDLLAAINSLHQGITHKLGLLNSAYLTLLPKKVDALFARDFRPISLIHSFAKLVTKMLANRLGPYLQELVASNQSAFVRGRSIHDNFMLV
jgi:exonuclease III